MSFLRKAKGITLAVALITVAFALLPISKPSLQDIKSLASQSSLKSLQAIPKQLLSRKSSSAPKDFEQAKIALKENVYFDRNTGATGTAYCGCDWRWVGRSAGRIDYKTCGYKTGSDPVRDARIEWEHIYAMAASSRHRKCWKEGGRKNCRATDRSFNELEADMFNLVPIIGSLNNDAQDYPMGTISSRLDGMYGSCETKVDKRNRLLEPQDSVKGLVARTMLYMAHRYGTDKHGPEGITLSYDQQKLFMEWHEKFPVSEWELQRNDRIAKIMGHDNEFVTGAKTWTLSRGPVYSSELMDAPLVFSELSSPKINTSRKSGRNYDYTGSESAYRSKPERRVKTYRESTIRGNSRSNVYHLPHCPSYSAMAHRNRVLFTSEAAARAAGFRRAKNCN